MLLLLKFIKLHQRGKEILVNMNGVSEVYTTRGCETRLVFNFSADEQVVRITVDESIDKILELIKQANEWQTMRHEGKLF